MQLSSFLRCPTRHTFFFESFCLTISQFRYDQPCPRSPFRLTFYMVEIFHQAYYPDRKKAVFPAVRLQSVLALHFALNTITGSTSGGLLPVYYLSIRIAGDYVGGEGLEPPRLILDSLFYIATTATSNGSSANSAIPPS